MLLYHISLAQLVSMISKGSYDLESGMWKKISNEAKSLIRQLMEVDPEKRLSAKSALEHPWIIQ